MERIAKRIAGKFVMIMEKDYLRGIIQELKYLEGDFLGKAMANRLMERDTETMEFKCISKGVAASIEVITARLKAVKTTILPPDTTKIDDSNSIPATVPIGTAAEVSGGACCDAMCGSEYCPRCGAELTK